MKNSKSLTSRKKETNVSPALRVCSLFSGCGGLDLGLVGGFNFLGVKYPKTGIEIVWSADFDKDAVATYRSNKRYLGTHPIFDKDIREFDDFDSLPDFDVLTAGFPCQPFSNAGNREGVNDKHGRGTLFEECVRFIEAKRPKAYVFENVKGILSSRTSSGKTVPEEISDRMRDLGYSCSGAFLAKSQHYGVPQQRQRVLIIGLRNDLGRVFDYASLSQFVQPASLEKLTVKDAISGVKGTVNHDDVWHLSPQAKVLVRMITRSWKDIPYKNLPPRFKRIRDNMEKYHAPNFYRRFAYSEINGTITASAQPENCGILHPVLDRRYSVREVARIQSFPDDFVFQATTIAGKYKVIGNAVPPILGYVVGKALINAIFAEPAGPKLLEAGNGGRLSSKQLQFI